MDHNSQIRNVYTAAGMQENRKLDAIRTAQRRRKRKAVLIQEKTADEKKEQEKQAYRSI